MIATFSAIFLAVIDPTALKALSVMMSLNPVKMLSLVGAPESGKANSLISFVISMISGSTSSSSLKIKYLRSTKSQEWLPRVNKEPLNTQFFLTRRERNDNNEYN